ncbi:MULTISPECIES: biosynthetic peptidoglycan transglycosylase [Aequorivita]|uniref:Transglycosylase domain-containing protein n=1 Tax=Aequorivita iocasae TaxID=2803865 RepID=A0ABX7DR23_9FLAO|nr:MULTISPECIES: biosynthetic peptidoglycan transglycosylase [Aequorivita]QQX76458.1 transglycosylase domain-containing protein [Aequorivita iocasae]UCA55930.1 transglycosylase domain-containing protein [Aequorivita sp. F7]
MICSLYSYFIKIVDFFLTKEVFSSIFSGIITGLFLGIVFFVIKDYLSKKNNISGRWLMYETIYNSDYNPYIGMKLVSTINVLHSDKNVQGTGEKVSEITLKAGLKDYVAKERTKFKINGDYEWHLARKNRLKFIYEHTNNNGRQISSFVFLKNVKKDRFEGWFISEAANSTGTITLIKQDVAVFGKGFLFFTATIISKILNVSLVENIEHHFLKYYARSKYFKKENPNFTKILVGIEDPKFKTHKGFVAKSLIRGFLSRFKIVRKKFNLIKSGGSTITMQLARTLFIKDYNKKWRRKILEIIFALYLEKILTKNEILNLYLSSARFHPKINGIKNAIKHHNFNRYEDLSNEESFFLIERLSSIKENYSLKRVKLLLRKITGQPLTINYRHLLSLYSSSGYKRIK